VSRDPRRISASSSLRQKSLPPQAGQKLRPEKVAISPLWEKAWRGQTAKKTKAEPLDLRQSAQWQRPVRNGSPSTR
jgi:hypothetical protein